MEDLFKSFDAYISDRLQGNELSEPQKLVLSYLIKSEWANERLNYTILLTPDNNHFNELLTLEKAGLIHKHPSSTALHPIYQADRVLMKSDFTPELRQMFGQAYDELNELQKKVLGVVYRYNHYSKVKRASAKQASFILWVNEEQRSDDIRAFDTFYRQVRYACNRLEKGGFMQKQPGSRGYLLTEDFKKKNLV